MPGQTIDGHCSLLTYVSPLGNFICSEDIDFAQSENPERISYVSAGQRPAINCEQCRY